MRLSDLGEFELIARLRKQLRPPGPGVVIGLGDDAAVIQTQRHHLLAFTTDTLVEGVHFRLDWTSPEDLGWKAMAQSISDIAAMGGEPRHAVISVAVRDDQAVEMVEQLYAGLEECAARYGASIVGGDTVHTPGPVVVTVALLGEVTRSLLITRAGAQVGDAILVTGELGAASAGLMLLERGGDLPDELAEAVRAQHRPLPRVEAARLLAESGLARSMIDLSDGLGNDLRRICEESGVGARVELEGVPVSSLVIRTLNHLQTARDPLELAITGGEDFELLITAKPDDVMRLRALMATKLRARLTVVGQVTQQQEGIVAVKKDGVVVPLMEGYTHFRSGEAQP